MLFRPFLLLCTQASLHRPDFFCLCTQGQPLCSEQQQRRVRGTFRLPACNLAQQTLLLPAPVCCLPCRVVRSTALSCAALLSLAHVVLVDISYLLSPQVCLAGALWATEICASPPRQCTRMRAVQVCAAYPLPACWRSWQSSRFCLLARPGCSPSVQASGHSQPMSLVRRHPAPRASRRQTPCVILANTRLTSACQAMHALDISCLCSLWSSYNFGPAPAPSRPDCLKR